MCLALVLERACVAVLPTISSTMVSKRTTQIYESILRNTREDGATGKRYPEQQSPPLLRFNHRLDDDILEMPKSWKMTFS